MHKITGMVTYFSEDTSFIFKEKRLTSRWLKLVAESEIRRLGDIAVIFCSDNYILDVNMKYLQPRYGLAHVGIEGRAYARQVC